MKMVIQNFDTLILTKASKDSVKAVKAFVIEDYATKVDNEEFVANQEETVKNIRKRMEELEQLVKY